MKSITANLARSQLKNNRKRTVVTIIGIALSVAMITAVFGFSASGINTMRNLAGEENLSNYRPVLVSLSAVLGTIIILSSIVVISNAFRISASERMRQFGILKSVGATKRQILKIVLQEGLFLSLVAIPAGMIAGLLVEWLGTSIGDALLAPMNKLLNTGLSIHMQFVLSWESLLLALCLSFATVMVSAYIPARKAARIPAIDAIRLTQEVKPTGRKPRAHKLVRLLFGFEGTLAAKSIRRSRRSYRAMVVALTISVVLFLICGSLDAQLAMAVNQTYANIDATSILTFSVNQSDSGPLDADSMQALTDKLKEYPDTQLYGVGIDGTHTIRISETALTDTMLSSYEPGQTEDGIILLAPDPEHYAELCQLAGVPVGSNILLNSTQLVINEKQTEFQPVRFSGQTLTVYHNGTATALPLDAQLTGTQVPQELLFVSEAALIVVVPDTEAYMYVWLGNSLDTTGFTEYAETVMYDFRQTYTSFSVTDITAVTDMTR
ncbi:MAG TPA: ABC transporter permease, partial [Candidatus Limiplasma sp.]|nr:ABC transporter permease [Candidatus Limiplasma sp.]